MRIAIFGVGGVGGYFGGKLAQSDHEVAFIARGRHGAAIAEHGLRVHAEGGDFTAYPSIVTAEPADVGAVDVVVVATKAWQVVDAAEAMQPLLHDDTVIVPLLNGVEAPLQLADVLGAERVLGGFCRVLSRISAPGEITQGGTPPFVAFGEMNGAQSQRVTDLKALFETAGITAQTPQSIQAAMWQKLLFISSFGGVGAVTRMPAGILRGVPQIRALVEDAMREVKAVAEARGVPMAADAVQRGMSLLDNLPEQGTASMQRDIMNGYPSELDAQNGAVVRLGAAADVAVQTHRYIYHSLLAQEQIAREQLTLPE